MTPENIISIFLGIGLAAAVGFRVFIPLFIMSIVTYFGHLHLVSSFAWIGSFNALLLFAIATIIELLAYFVPFIDNVLDTIAVPLAAIAGTIVMAAVLVDLPEVMTWSLAIIAGGGTAAAISGTTATTRVASSTTTLGIANPLIATAEIGSSLIISLLAIVVPVISMIVVVVILYLLYRLAKKILKNKK